MRFRRLHGVLSAHRRSAALGAAFLLLLLVSLPVLAASALVDLDTEAGQPEVLLRLPASTAAHAGLGVPAAALGLLVLMPTLIPEFLSSHFGEKRPDAGGNGLLSVRLILLLLTTALFPVPSYLFRAAPEKWRYQP